MKTSVRWIAFAVVVLLLSSSGMGADDRKAEVGDAQKKLERLKTRLPGIVAAWAQACDHYISREQVKVRLARRTTATEAKITILIDNYDLPDLMTFCLRYHDGAWTTTHREMTDTPGRKDPVLYLVLAIDKAGDKCPDEEEEKAVHALRKSLRAHSLSRRFLVRDIKEDGMPVIALNFLGAVIEVPPGAPPPNMPMTDAELRHVAAFKQLRTLWLSGTQVTDKGLKELAKLERLQEVSLCETQVTDAGLKELAALKQLRELDVCGTKVTDAGIAELQKALPELKITRDKPSPYREK